MLSRDSLVNCFLAGCRGVMFPVWRFPGIWTFTFHSIYYRLLQLTTGYYILLKVTTSDYRINSFLQVILSPFTGVLLRKIPCLVTNSILKVRKCWSKSIVFFFFSYNNLCTMHKYWFNITDCQDKAWSVRQLEYAALLVWQIVRAVWVRWLERSGYKEILARPLQLHPSGGIRHQKLHLLVLAVVLSSTPPSIS